jgi:hypothetical protein
MHNLLSWVHPGFTVFAGQPVEAGNLESLESQARYIARPAMAMEALQQRPDGTLAMETAPDPRSGATLLVLDALEWIHRIVAQIFVGSKCLRPRRRLCPSWREDPVGRLGDRDGRRIAASVARKLPVPSRQFADGPHPSPEFADFSAKAPVFPLCALIECPIGSPAP